MNKFLLAILMFLLPATGLAFDIIIDENFEDGNRNGWYKQNGTSSYHLAVLNDSAGIGSGNALYLSNNSTSITRHLVRSFDSIELATPGDRIELQFDVRMTTSVNADSGFRFGINNSNGTILTADESGDTTTDDDYGYFVTMATGSGASRVRIYEDPGTSSVNGGSGINRRAEDYSFPRLNTTSRTVKYSITRAESGVIWNLSVDDAVIFDTVEGDTSSPVTVFDELVFTSTSGVDWAIDNIKMTVSIITVGFNSQVVTALKDSLATSTEIINLTDANKILYVRQRVYEDEDTSALPFLNHTSTQLSLDAGDSYTHSTLSTGLSPKLWSPESPNLYLLRTEILDSSMTVISTSDTTIGFRTLEIVGKHLYLNDKPVYLFTWHKTPASRIPGNISDDPAFIAQHISRYKNANVNFIRLNEGISESWYEACDRAGIMVMTGPYSGAGTTDTNKWLNNLSRLETEIPRLRNHACVVMWILGNEWVLSSPGMPESAEQLFYAVKAIDSSRLLFNTWSAKYYNSGDLIAATGSEFLDYHSYRGWYGNSVYGFYNYHTNESYPVTLSECVGAYTHQDPEYMGFLGKPDKQAANQLRTVGHSYKIDEDSLWYQAYLTRQLSEILRRERGPDSSFCGAMPFTDGYAYGFLQNPSDITEIAKPVLDEVAKAYKPIHISIRNPYPNQYAGNSVSIRFFVMNDDVANYYPSLPDSTLIVKLVSPDGGVIWNKSISVPAVDYYDSWDVNLSINIPSNAVQGDYTIVGRLLLGQDEIAVGRDSMFIAEPVWAQISNPESASVAIYDLSGKTQSKLESLGLTTTNISSFVHDGTVFTDGFEGCFANWDCTGFCSANSYEGVHSCKMDQDEYAVAAISMAGYEMIAVNYVRNLSGLTVGDEFVCQWFDGSQWHTLENITEGFADWTQVKFPLPASAENNNDFKLRFKVTSQAGNYAYVDNVDIRSNRGGLESFQAVVIGKNSFDNVVAAAESVITDFIDSGGRVLVLEQDSSVARTAINSVNWLGTSLTLSGSGKGEDFVNIERPYLTTLMDGIDRTDFRIWNRNGSSLPQDRTLYERYYDYSISDMEKIAVLGNGGAHLSHGVLLEIFTGAGTEGSCIFSQLRTVDRYNEDPLADKYLANLLSYLLEDVQHYKNVLVDKTIELSRFESEKGLICAPLKQGMYILSRQGEGRLFRGHMKVVNGLGYLEEQNTSDTEAGSLYFRTKYDLGRNPIVMDVENDHDLSLNYRVTVNGWTSSWVTLLSGQRLQSSFTLPSVIGAGENVKFTIEADEGKHSWGYGDGLIFHSIQLVDPGICDFVKDGEFNISDLAVFFLHWLEDGTVTGDVNSSGRVDLEDFSICAEFWKEWQKQ